MSNKMIKCAQTPLSCHIKCVTTPKLIDIIVNKPTTPKNNFLLLP